MLPGGSSRNGNLCNISIKKDLTAWPQQFTVHQTTEKVLSQLLIRLRVHGSLGWLKPCAVEGKKKQIQCAQNDFPLAGEKAKPIPGNKQETCCHWFTSRPVHMHEESHCWCSLLCFMCRSSWHIAQLKEVLDDWWMMEMKKIRDQSKQSRLDKESLVQSSPIDPLNLRFVRTILCLPIPRYFNQDCRQSWCPAGKKKY